MMIQMLRISPCLQTGRQLASTSTRNHVFTRIKIQDWHFHSLAQHKFAQSTVVGLRYFHVTPVVQSDQHQSKKENSPNDKLPFFFGLGLSAFISYMLYITFTDGGSSDSPFKFSMSFKDFVEEVLPTGEVVALNMNSYSGGHKARAMLRRGASFKGNSYPIPVLIEITDIKNAEEFERIIRNAEKAMGLSPTEGIPIRHQLVSTGDAFAAVGLLLATVTLVILLISRAQSVMRSSGGMTSVGKLTPSSNIKKVQTGIKFTDVAGCSEAKQEVMEFVHYLKHPEKYQKLGAKMPRGCLLTGPPGVGKTLLAKAVASEAEVPFISKAGSDFVEMIGGLGAKRVRELFKEARSVAPCIVYIDELDAVGAKRSSDNSQMSGASERDQTLNQILVEMDGILSTAHDVIVMASTNRVDMLDKALLRPGRFDRHISIDLPTKIERKDIFEIHMNKLKLKDPHSPYSDRLADLSPGMSGADIANICNEAAICAARDKDTHIDASHFEQAFERVLGGSKKKSSALSPDERKIVSVHEAGHTLVGWMLKYTDTLVKVSIVPRTKSALGFSRTLQRETKMYTSRILMEIMATRLAGRSAENLVFGTVTHGAEDDLKKVTDMAYMKVKEFGLNPVVGNLSFSKDEEEITKPYSDSLAQEIDIQVKNTVIEAHQIAHNILVANRSKLDILSKELLEKEVLNYDDVKNLIGPPPYSNHGDEIMDDVPNLNT